MGLLANFCVTVICLLSLFQLNSCLYNEDESETIVSTHTSLSSQQSLLPDCNKDKIVSQTKHNELLIISTLDGKLTALDVERDGDLKWSQKINSEALLSSTISNFELTKKGQIVRIVPSLDGNLYLYNGKTIDGIPLNAETLLRSSYKLGDDLVITGGQESKVLAINILTGHVYYECGVKGCPASQLNENETFDDMFLVKRITQTVRAIEPRTGKEKWHFSVSEPQLSAVPSAHCHQDSDTNHFYDERQNEYNVIDNPSQAVKETDFKVLVPNGIISVKKYLKSGDSIQWQYKFESPIVHIWNYRNGHLNQLNLFDKQKLFGFANIEFNSKIMEPSIYIGRYQQQWYIQPSNKIKEHISQTKVQSDLLANEKTKSNSNVLQIEWKPQALIYNDKSLDSEKGFELVPSPQFSLSPSTLNDDNEGYYLLNIVEDNETQCHINESDNLLNIDWDYDKGEDEENGIMQQIVIASLWHYWKEVAAISIVSAFLLNFLYSYLKRKLKSKCKVLNCEEKSGDNSPSISTQDRTPSTPSFSLPFNQFNNGDNNDYVSRYLADFEPIQILGKGGFGLVFEAKHRIDESHYAIKRICLPCRKEQRDKVMREVKALSKLDHSGIVRYYNAWLEFPPPGWQESLDKQWKSEDISAAQSFDHCLESKQVFNKSLASDYKFSLNLMSRETRTETNYSLCDSKMKSFTETQGSQSLDIVFEENASSIRLFEKSYSLLNSSFTHNKSLDSKANDCKMSAGLADAKGIEQSILLKSSSRPNSFNPPLPRCYLYIQMQLCRKDTLKDWLFANSSKRDSDLVLDIFNQIVSAVHYVHSMGLMHRDLKPSNIFFSMDGIIKIGDFGLVTATAIDEETHTPALNNDCFDENDSIFSNDSNTHTNRVGTQLYMSPEQIKNAPYSHKVDIFSLGIILFELLVPIKTEMERNVLLNNARKRKFPNDFCLNFKTECNLLKRLLSHDPEKRPSTAEIKEHELLISFQSTTDSMIRERRRTVSQSSAELL